MLNNSMVEIIWVAFVLVLELVEEVEDIESECCFRTFNCCWKPAGTEKLVASGNRGTARAVTDNEAVSTRQVKYHEVVRRGRMGTCVASIVPKLGDKANRSEGGTFEEVAIPFLRT